MKELCANGSKEKDGQVEKVGEGSSCSRESAKLVKGLKMVGLKPWWLM